MEIKVTEILRELHRQTVTNEEATYEATSSQEELIS